MEMSGEHTIAASRQTVWEALNDPEILKQCIPGCEEIEQTEENTFSAKVKAKVGPVNSRFSGKVTLSNLNPPESYTISGEGSGGAAGFAKGGADVQLEEIDAEQTKLTYQVKAQVGGKLAQLGQRLIKSTADKYARQFFDKFQEIVGGGKPEEAETAAAEATGTETAATAAAAGDGSSARAQASGVADSGGTEAAAQDAREAAPAAKSDGAAGSAQSGGQPAESSGGQPSGSGGGGLSPKVWIGGLIAAVAVLLILLLA
jgi:hypothetical protein